MKNFNRYFQKKFQQIFVDQKVTIKLIYFIEI